jgi:hypothetical protein
MLKANLLFLSILIFISAIGQNKRSIEFSFIGKYDRHADYVSNFAGRVYNDTNKLYGKSFGANIIYRQNLTKTVSVFLGVGYYRLGIDRIKGSTPFNIPGGRTNRSIDYFDGISNLLYATSKYHYNNLAVTAGLSKTSLLKNNFYLDFSIEGISYYTFSQRYQLLNGRRYYSTNNTKPLEFGVNATFGILKEYKKIYIRPSLLIPIYQNLKGDKVFYERRDMNISKWFNGIGVTFRIGKYI